MSQQTVTRYVSRGGPRLDIIEGKKPKTVCAWESEPGPPTFQTVCKPVAGRPGWNECHIEQIANPERQLIPSECSTTNVSFRRGVKVTRTSMDRNGVVTRTRVDEPEIKQYDTFVTKTRDPKKAIPYEILPRVQNGSATQPEPNKVVQLVPTSSSTVVNGARQIAPQRVQRDVGGGATRGSATQSSLATSGKKKGGNIQMPNPRAVAKDNFAVNRDDEDQLNLPEGMIELPAGLSLSDENSFFRSDSGEFGIMSARQRANGYQFADRDQPYQQVQSRDLLGYLINTVTRLQLLYPDDFAGMFDAYDAAQDTNATLESKILSFFGRMETKKYFDRPAIFKSPPSVAEFDKMTESLQLYIATPPKQVWVSLLANRYIPLEGASQDEIDAYDQLKQFLVELRKILDAQNIKLVMPPFASEDERATLGELEDSVLDTLARLQLLGYGVRISPDSPLEGPVNNILKVGNRRHFRSDTIAYLDLFRDPTPSDQPLIYLPALRRKLLEAQDHQLAKAKRRPVLSSRIDRLRSEDFSDWIHRERPATRMSPSRFRISPARGGEAASEPVATRSATRSGATSRTGKRHSSK